MPLSQRIRAIIDANTPPDQRGYYYRMAEKESGGNPNDTSSTGAKGIFQFTRGTGRTYGLVGSGGDIRGDPVANTKAMVRLTEDNRKRLVAELGREPSHSELALAHQQGAGTAANMLRGVGNASPSNLAANNVRSNAGPQEAASKIMNYYGFDKNPMVGFPPPQGVSLASSPFPAIPPGPVPPVLPPGPTTTAVPYINPAVGTGVSLATAPVPPTPTAPDWASGVGTAGGVNMVTPPQVPPVAPSDPATATADAGPLAKLATAMQDKDGKPSDLSTGLDTVAKGLSPKIAPVTMPAIPAMEPNQPSALAAQLMQAMMQKQQRRGLSLTG